MRRPCRNRTVRMARNGTAACIAHASHRNACHLEISGAATSHFAGRAGAVNVMPYAEFCGVGQPLVDRPNVAQLFSQLEEAKVQPSRDPIEIA
jgi:hypothetical protein